jgi:hypothetical protein
MKTILIARDRRYAPIAELQQHPEIMALVQPGSIRYGAERHLLIDVASEHADYALSVINTFQTILRAWVVA